MNALYAKRNFDPFGKDTLEFEPRLVFSFIKILVPGVTNTIGFSIVPIQKYSIPMIFDHHNCGRFHFLSKIFACSQIWREALIMFDFKVLQISDYARN